MCYLNKLKSFSRTIGNYFSFAQMLTYVVGDCGGFGVTIAKTKAGKSYDFVGVAVRKAGQFH